MKLSLALLFVVATAILVTSMDPFISNAPKKRLDQVPRPKPPNTKWVVGQTSVAAPVDEPPVNAETLNELMRTEKLDLQKRYELCGGDLFDRTLADRTLCEEALKKMMDGHTIIDKILLQLARNAVQRNAAKHNLKKFTSEEFRQMERNSRQDRAICFGHMARLELNEKELEDIKKAVRISIRRTRGTFVTALVGQRICRVDDLSYEIAESIWDAPNDRLNKALSIAREKGLNIDY